MAVEDVRLGAVEDLVGDRPLLYHDGFFFGRLLAGEHAADEGGGLDVVGVGDGLLEVVGNDQPGAGFPRAGLAFGQYLRVEFVRGRDGHRLPG